MTTNEIEKALKKNGIKCYKQTEEAKEDTPSGFMLPIKIRRVAEIINDHINNKR